MSDWSPLEEDVWLTGTLVILVRDGKTGRPRAGQAVTVRACGFT
jgi:hypothetical protein